MKVQSTKDLGAGKGIVRLLEAPDTNPGEVLEAWTPELEKVKALGDGPVPGEWALRDNKQGTGKVLLPPKERGAVAYRNTREAFEAEARSRSAWQELEEERKDRRTALMSAVDLYGPASAAIESSADILELSNELYAWLRASIPGAAQNRSPARTEAGMSPSRRQGKAPGGTTPGGGTEGSRGGVDASSDDPSSRPHNAVEKAIGRSLTPAEIAELEGTTVDLGGP